MRQNPHVRICGGPGSATTLVYPTPSQKSIRSSPSHAGSASSQILNGSTRRSSKIASNTSPHRDPVQQGHITSSLPKPSLLPRST